MGQIYVATTGNDSTGIGSSGNPYATPGKAASVKSTADSVYIKSGTYTLTTSTANVAGGPVSDTTGGSGRSAQSTWLGYQTTPGDNLGQPIISAGSVTGVTIFAASGNFTKIFNIAVDGGNGSSNRGLDFTGAVVRAGNLFAKNCPNFGMHLACTQASLWGLFASGCNYGLEASGTDATLYGCAAATCTTAGINALRMARCISFLNNGLGYSFTGGTVFDCADSIAYGNSSHGFGPIVNESMILNSVSALNGGYGYANGGGTDALTLYTCADWNNTSGRGSGIGEDNNPVTMTGNPYNSTLIAAANTLALAFAAFIPNSTSGAGALLRGAGLIPYADLGAVQHQDAGGSGGIGFSTDMSGGF